MHAMRCFLHVTLREDRRKRHVSRNCQAAVKECQADAGDDGHFTGLQALMYKLISLFPVPLRSTLIAQMKDVPPPCRRVLEQSRFHYDASFMVFMEEFHRYLIESRSVLFPSADASSLRRKMYYSLNTFTYLAIPCIKLLMLQGH